jgi:ankyrin repeat protein
MAKGDSQLGKMNAGVEVEAGAQDGIVLAASRGHEAAVKLPLDNGADVNAKDAKGWTALHRAALQHKPMVCLLLDNGADIEARDKRGCTALHRAAASGQRAIVETFGA